MVTQPHIHKSCGKTPRIVLRIARQAFAKIFAFKTAMSMAIVAGYAHPDDLGVTADKLRGLVVELFSLRVWMSKPEHALIAVSLVALDLGEASIGKSKRSSRIFSGTVSALANLKVPHVKEKIQKKSYKINYTKSVYNF